PRRRHVLAKQMLGTARLVPDHRRPDVAIPELGADHLVRLALLDVRDSREVLARRLSFRRRVTDVRPVLRAPLASSLRRVARRADVAIADLAPLDLVRREN